ncbi:MAG: DUF5119 domain-containing protein [Alistipes sp.]|nr:DUF5119 domain-containing protein [Alistipes sp.]
MKSILKRYLLCGLSVILSTTGCTKKDLDSRADEGYVEIVLDWGSDRPAGKRFDFYPVEGGEPLTFLSDAPECNVPGCEGFKGSLPSGDYRMIVASCEEGQCVEFGNSHRYESAAFFVSHVAESRAGEVKGYSNRIEHVGRLMFTRQFDDDTDVLKVPYQQKVKRTATPKSYVKHVTLNFRIENPETITKCEGVFVGVAESVNCCTGACSATTASIDFKAERTRAGESAGFAAEFSVLDLIDPGEKTGGVHTVYLTVVQVREDGTTEKMTTTIDVTGAVQHIIDINDGTIPLDIVLPLELKILEDGSLEADVEEWLEGTGSGDVVSSGTVE